MGIDIEMISTFPPKSTLFATAVSPESLQMLTANSVKKAIPVILMSNIKNYDGLTQLNSFIKRANDSLNEAQREELAKAELDIPVGLKIASYGNIIYHKGKVI